MSFIIAKHPVDRDNICVYVIQQIISRIYIHEHRAAPDKRLYKPIYISRQMSLNFIYQLVFVSHIE